MSNIELNEGNFRFIAARELPVLPTDWMINGLIETSTVVSLFGPPGVAKTFIALDMACCVATGKPFHDCEVTAGSVFYVAGEGFNGLSRRVDAWATLNHAARPEHLYLSNRAIDLYHSDKADTVVDEIESTIAATGIAPQLIVIDTLARNFTGEENSARDVGIFIQNLDSIRYRWAANVLVVHHTGKDIQRGARGSTALRAAVDTEYEVARGSDTIIRVECKKMKDALPPQPQGFELIDVDISTIEGEVIKSAALKRIALGSDQARVPSGRNQKLAMDVLRQLYSKYSGTGDENPKITEGCWRAGCHGAGLEQKRIGEAISGLVRNGFVKIVGNRVTLLGWEPPPALSEKPSVY